MNYTVKDILRIQVAPALGCTEPVAIALGAAAAVSVLPEKSIDQLTVCVDPNIYKNGLSVSIPGTDGQSGLDFAGALGALGGDPTLKLEVLAPIDAGTVSAARQLIDQNKVTVNLLSEQTGLYIRITVKSGSHTAESIIKDMHDNIVSLTLNGQSVPDSPLLRDASGENGDLGLPALESWLKTVSVADVIAFLDDLDAADFAFLEQGIHTNKELALYGIKHGSGLGVGKTLERLARQGLIKRDMILSARILTSAAADARMSGVKMTAMASAGSGNHGLTAILPICAVQDFLDVTFQTVLEAIALSHMITAYIKAFTGRLSAVCGCSIAAGAGAAAGVCYMLGGDIRHIASAIKNLIEDLAGVICDGAKPGCALKLSTAAGTAVQAALFSLHGVNVRPTGIISVTPEQTMKNIGTLSTQGMIETDRTILKIMLEKQFASIR